MRQIQVIQLRGRTAALTIGEDAIIADHITGSDRQVAAGMALYALQIQAGQRPGPYTDTDAERYARHTLARRTQPRPQRRPGHTATP